MKTMLFMVHTAPHGSAAIPESHRACLGFATMPFEVNYVLVGDAVWALQTGQQANAIGGVDARGLIAELADLGVNVFAETDALDARDLPREHLEAVVPVSASEIADMIAGADAVMTY